MIIVVNQTVHHNVPVSSHVVLFLSKYVKYSLLNPSLAIPLNCFFFNRQIDSASVWKLNRLDPVEILYSRHTLFCMTKYVHYHKMMLTCFPITLVT